MLTDSHLPSAEDGSRGALLSQHLPPASLSGTAAVSRHLGLLSLTGGLKTAEMCSLIALEPASLGSSCRQGHTLSLPRSWLPWGPLTLAAPGLLRYGVCLSTCAHDLPLGTAGVGLQPTLTQYNLILTGHISKIPMSHEVTLAGSGRTCLWRGSCLTQYITKPPARRRALAVGSFEH